jgi:hypothetical protein
MFVWTTWNASAFSKSSFAIATRSGIRQRVGFRFFLTLECVSNWHTSGAHRPGLCYAIPEGMSGRGFVVNSVPHIRSQCFGPLRSTSLLTEVRVIRRFLSHFRAPRPSLQGPNLSIYRDYFTVSRQQQINKTWNLVNRRLWEVTGVSIKRGLKVYKF